MDKARLCWIACACRRYSIVGGVHSDDDQRFGILGSMGMGGMAEPVGEQPHRIRGVVAAQQDWQPQMSGKLVRQLKESIDWPMAQRAGI
ncbi:hypothetical protein AIN02nite_28600 [Acetobacter indonesiensis]|uniref:Uncharacterized protein n=1 Tax=Acetobacter indonesiensis TaxID=104101 RepID=A0A6N3T8E8_9PROT|nr:hypothetical protein Abin_070_004 [Acetobacter indonesiensis]GEN04835.1 hypothetical protein AIN02nite_28600 [Acetobacter indonesiensis]